MYYIAHVSWTTTKMFCRGKVIKFFPLEIYYVTHQCIILSWRAARVLPHGWIWCNSCDTKRSDPHLLVSQYTGKTGESTCVTLFQERWTRELLITRTAAAPSVVSSNQTWPKVTWFFPRCSYSERLHQFQVQCEYIWTFYTNIPVLHILVLDYVAIFTPASYSDHLLILYIINCFKLCPLHIFTSVYISKWDKDIATCRV